MHKATKLVGLNIQPFCQSPLLGVLLLDTDQGAVDVAIDRRTAERLSAELQRFLDSTKH